MQEKSYQLGDVAKVTAGHPIRGAVRNVPGGDVAVVQIKNMDAEQGVNWPAVARTRLESRREPDWLKAGESRDLCGVLYVSREHAPLIMPHDRLSSEAAEILNALLEHPDMASNLKERLPTRTSVIISRVPLLLP